MAEVLARWSHIIQLSNPEIKLANFKINIIHAYYLGYFWAIFFLVLLICETNASSQKRKLVCNVMQPH